MIAAGSLNRRIAIHSPEIVSNAVGEEVATWGHVATVWAARKTLSLREVNRMAGAAEAVEAKFEIRYRSDITTGMEIEAEGRRYGIAATDEIGNREGLSLIVRAIS